MFIDSTKNATIDQFVVGLRYYSKIFASNEIGLGWPTKSIPSFEIPRAAPPATYDDPLPVRKWCDASQLTPFGNTFCGNFCLTSDGTYANDIATALASSTTCEDTARETCLSQRFQERACSKKKIIVGTN